MRTDREVSSHGLLGSWAGWTLLAADAEGEHLCLLKQKMIDQTAICLGCVEVATVVFGLLMSALSHLIERRWNIQNRPWRFQDVKVWPQRRNLRDENFDFAPATKSCIHSKPYLQI